MESDQLTPMSAEEFAAAIDAAFRTLKVRKEIDYASSDGFVAKKLVERLLKHNIHPFKQPVPPAPDYTYPNYTPRPKTE